MPVEALSMHSAEPKTVPVVDPLEENALRGLVRTFGLLERVMQPYFARFGITGAVDRLERAGLVVRDASPTDLRAKQVRLTAEGRRRLEQVLRGHKAQI